MVGDESEKCKYEATLDLNFHSKHLLYFRDNSYVVSFHIPQSRSAATFPSPYPFLACSGKHLKKIIVVSLRNKHKISSKFELRLPLVPGRIQKKMPTQLRKTLILPRRIARRLDEHSEVG